MKLLIKMLTFFSCFFTISTQSFADTASLEHYSPYFVGELGTAWEFPSDHLPIGATVGNFHISFWNILNKNYLGHIEENTQGLRHSSILRDDIRIDKNQPLTVREGIVLDQIMQMRVHPTHPRALIALQETHQDVFNSLKKNLPADWVIVTPPQQSFSQDIFLYDTAVFDFINKEAVLYTPPMPKSIFTLTLREKLSGKIFRFIQSHIPGGPINSAEGCAKFAQEVLRQYDPSMTIVLMGDMNQSPSVIERALEKAAKETDASQLFQYLPVSYPSHMNTHCEASWIDNFFVYCPEGLAAIRASDQPEELCSILPPIVHLLKEFQSQEPSK